jgi:sterol desaturase/sphingolipid hydroxylase (fatty acid hydroxylase superfamily)
MSDASSLASVESVPQERDSRGEWIPAAPESYRPLFVWPPQPVALLKWIVAYPGFLVPRHTAYLLISLATWFWLTPPLERCASFRWDWMAFVYARNFILIMAYYSFYHVLLYVLKIEGDHGKYNPNWPAKKNRKFLFHDQTLDNVFWTAGPGVLIFTAFEVVTWWLYANDFIPMVKWSESPVWCVILLLILPFWREFHFYWIHRLIHWRPLYTHVHYLHHKNHNPNPWSGMAMHPVETILYFSVVMFNWVVPSNPIHFLFLLQTTALLPAATHHGFHGPILAGMLPTGSYFHYMHHKFYECNYGGSLIPLDKWFGTFRSSTSRDAAFKSKREHTV